MIESVPPASEPRPLRGTVVFEKGDFHALTEALAADPQFNDRRLKTRRKLLALGKRAVRAAGDAGCPLECRTSLHHPHAFNGMRVRRQWAYLTRVKAEKRRLRGVLGPELGKDLDAAYRNAYLFIALEAEALEVGLGIHPEAWYDGQNLVHRIRAEGIAPWRDLLNDLPRPWRLRMHDWKGVWECGSLTDDRLEEYLSYYTPGDHRLTVSRRWPVPAAAREGVCGPDVPDELVGEVLRLLPLYRHTVWSQESDHLLSR